MTHIRVKITEPVGVEDLDQFPRPIYKKVNPYIMDEWHAAMRGTWAKMKFVTQPVICLVFTWR